MYTHTHTHTHTYVYIYILYIYIYIRAESPGVALGSVATNEVYLFWKDK